jgi:hypothetical protein
MKDLAFPIIAVGCLLTAGILTRCPTPEPAVQHQLTFANETSSPTTVYVAFGSNSVVLPTNWSSFCTGSGLNCTFPIAANSTQVAPLAGQYLNATIAFNAPVNCGSTKAEMNINTSNNTDNYDVSLVDGYSNNVKISIGGTILGPPNGKGDNQKVFGLFPFGCDICVARQQPPCGIPTGSGGCKSDTQYKPDVLCQYQSPTQGVPVKVSLVP